MVYFSKKEGKTIRPVKLHETIEEDPMENDTVLPVLDASTVHAH